MSQLLKWEVGFLAKNKKWDFFMSKNFTGRKNYLLFVLLHGERKKERVKYFV